MRIACIGDSITQHDRGPAAYPARLEVLLGGGHPVLNAGMSGCTLLRAGDKPYWTQGLLPEVAAFRPGLITLKLGTNDSKYANWNRHKAAFAGDLRDFLDRLGALPGAPRLILCLPAPAWSNPFTISGAAIEREIVPLIRAVAGERGLPVVDLHGPLRESRARFPDGVHPDDEGQALLAALLHRGLSGMVTEA